MIQNNCKKCGSSCLYTEVKNTNTGLYCGDCGTWQKWLNKDELRAFEHKLKTAVDNINNKTGVVEPFKIYYKNHEYTITEFCERMEKLEQTLKTAFNNLYVDNRCEICKCYNTCKIVANYGSFDSYNDYESNYEKGSLCEAFTWCAEDDIKSLID